MTIGVRVCVCQRTQWQPIHRAGGLRDYPGRRTVRNVKIDTKMRKKVIFVNFHRENWANFAGTSV